MSDFESVRKLNGCPICLKPDFCSYKITSDGQLLVLCRRDNSDNIKRARDGAAIHLLEYNMINDVTLISQIDLPLRASLSRRNAVYKELLSSLSLESKEFHDLKNRGLSTADIKILGYKSAAGADIEAELLINRGYILDRVPGFFFLKEENAWHANSEPGFFIPIMDKKGFIQGLQIRTYRSEAKYRWFSTKGWDRGASSGSPVHYRVGKPSTELWITESPLKADIAFIKSNHNSIATSGIRKSQEIVAEAMLYTTIILAYDMDWKINTDVRRVVINMIKEIQRRLGIDPIIAEWDQYKGLDDAILNLQSINLLSVKDFFKLSDAISKI